MRRFPSNDIISLVDAPPRFDLAESVGPDLRLGDLLACAGDDELADLRLGYGTAQGDRRLRGLLAQLHGVDADDVVTTVGGAHALFLLAFLLCEPGDEAITTSPVFPVTRSGLATVGASVRVLRSSFDCGYRLDLSELEALLTPRTKLVSLASPQNPSGVAIPLETLQSIVALLRRASPDAYLLVDETYREAAYGDAPITPSAVTLDERVIVTASLSKCHGAPGLRLGWVITRDALLREQVLFAKFNTVVSCSPLDEALAARLLERRDEILGTRRAHLAAAVASTRSWVQRNREYIEWVQPDAGALCCVRLRRDRYDAAAIRRFMSALGRHDARLAPGAWFGEETHVMRLGFGLLANADLQTALDQVSIALRESA